MEPGTALKEARKRAGLSQTELAERAETSQATISAYERGTKDPSVATLARLLAATGHRLRVSKGPAVNEPSRADLKRNGRRLAEVIGLAEALPFRRKGPLTYPRLDVLMRKASR